MVFQGIISENEKEFITKSISQGLRADGRSAYDFRKVEYTFDPSNYGQVTVQLGRTKVAAKASYKVVRPREGRPQEGLLIINSELYPIASQNFEVGKTSEEEVILSRLLEKTIRRSRALDLESLCIAAGEKVFEIRIDLHFLDHGGNLGDAGCLAVLASLLHFRRPDVTVQGEDVTIHTAEEKPFVPLTLHHLPVSVTFAFFNQGEHLVVDPTDLEEQVKDGLVTISMNLFQEICSLSKPGGTALPSEQLLRCIQLTTTISKQLIEQLKDIQNASG